MYRLGTNGRFGNQLFQYAALRGIAAHHGYDWCIPPEDHPTYANYGMHHPFKLQHLKNVGFVNSNNSPQAMFSYENIKQLNSIPNVKESVYYFDKEMFDNFEDGVLWAHNQVQTVFPFSGDGVLRRQR